METLTKNITKKDMAEFNLDIYTS